MTYYVIPLWCLLSGRNSDTGETVVALSTYVRMGHQALFSYLQHLIQHIWPVWLNYLWLYMFRHLHAKYAV